MDRPARTTPLDMYEAVEVWREYQRTHDRAEYAGHAVGIDTMTSEIVFAPSVAAWADRPTVRPSPPLVIGRTDRLRRRVG
jgi:hypothetical protein